MDSKRNSETGAEISSSAVLALRERVSAERWERIVREAEGRLDVVSAVEQERKASGLSRRKSLKKVAPDVPWSRYQSWCKRLQSRRGSKWERLLDLRLPPPPERISEAVRHAVVTLRFAVPEMDCCTARDRLVRQFGEIGRISNTSLRRIWSAAGLTQAADSQRVKQGDRYDGGAALAFILAADSETSTMTKLASAALEAARKAAAEQGEKKIEDEPAGRDERGRLTAEYNSGMRAGLAPGEPDARQGTDASKRQARDLGALATLRNRPETLAAKLLSIGVYGLLTERRGFEGLDGPRGALLGLLDCVPYMPATLSKCLAQLGFLGVGEALWGAHARQWNQVTKLWSEPEKPWLQMATYVDTTTDPYWTRRFALAGKVSQVGRVMPCLSRVYVHVGPGVPMAVDTFVGTVSLKKQLVPTLQRVESVVGQGELGRLTIVDAEIADFATLSALAAMPNRLFVTVWKGAGADPTAFQPGGKWQGYRKRDRVRDGQVVLHGRGESKEPLELKLRAVEMQRKHSRHPHRTIYLTNAPTQEYSTCQVAEIYLSRWPNQERRFRDARDGIGTDRSHGYGGEQVKHVALETSLEKSQRRQEFAKTRLERARQQVTQLEAARTAAKGTPQRAVLNRAVSTATREAKAAQKAYESAAREHRKNESMPRTIYKRDTTRDNIATVSVMSVIMLIEFVLREYFQGLKIEFRTFVEHLMNAPTTMISTRSKIHYRIEISRRHPEMASRLRHACAEVTHRKLRRDGRLLVFEAVDPPGQ